MFHHHANSQKVSGDILLLFTKYTGLASPVVTGKCCLVIKLLWLQLLVQMTGKFTVVVSLQSNNFVNIFA